MNATADDHWTRLALLSSHLKVQNRKKKTTASPQAMKALRASYYKFKKVEKKEVKDAALKNLRVPTYKNSQDKTGIKKTARSIFYTEDFD